MGSSSTTWEGGWRDHRWHVQRHPGGRIHSGDRCRQRFQSGDAINVANRSFPTQTELDAVAVCPAARVLTNNGRFWAWHSHSNALFNTAAPPNWKSLNGAGGAGVGGAGLSWDSCVGNRSLAQLPPRRRECLPGRWFGAFRKQQHHLADMADSGQHRGRTASGGFLNWVRVGHAIVQGPPLPRSKRRIA